MVMSHSIIKEENIMKILVTGGAGYIGCLLYTSGGLAENLVESLGGLVAA